ncbi:hypothetical protein DBB42_00995 [Pseudomonas plecoglossicida]|uniref:Uncharacterized protein n=1 Tax=Pseudomonas plecoglossicida TaxID=70775 RepID=A0A2R7UPS9_PSEDL|nr:hypothetical protein [Pseudomonas plecoglossicida]PTU54118.1 hypothetical protein DBB42_00995 [Pseudomonas plecoglossicida]
MTVSPAKQYRQKKIEVYEVHSNVSAELVEITSEKLELILRQYVDCLQGRSAWHAPLGIVLTLIVVLSTTTFNSKLGLSADTWAALFVMGLVLSVGWLGRSLWRLKKVMTVDQLMNKLKNKE